MCGHVPARDESTDAKNASTGPRSRLRGYVPAMYAFGLTCEHPGCRRSWLRAAAEEGHVEAMYSVTQKQEDFEERKRWLKMAAEEGHGGDMYDWVWTARSP